MKHKFQALFGCSILPPFERAGLPVRFLHDSTAYILGEVSDGNAAGREGSLLRDAGHRPWLHHDEGRQGSDR